MEDNKKTNTPGNNKPADTGSKPVSIDLFGTKSKDELTKGAKEQKAEFGSAGVDDINKNLGSFGNTVVKPQQVNTNDIKLDVDAKVVEKASKEQINFERFKKTKKTEKQAKTKFGEKVSIMLRSKKGLRATWIIEMLVMAITIAAGIALVVVMKRWWGYKGDGPMGLPEVQDPFKVGYVFLWISIFPCLIPLIYLLTTWFIGINEVHKSRLYHYIFWGCAAFGLICLLIGIFCCIPAFNGWISWGGY